MNDNVFYQFVFPIIENKGSYVRELDIRVADVRVKMEIIGEIEKIETNVRLLAKQYVAALAESTVPGAIPKSHAANEIDAKINGMNATICSIVSKSKVEKIKDDLNSFNKQIKFEIVTSAFKGNANAVRPKVDIVLGKAVLGRNTTIIFVRCILSFILQSQIFTNEL